MGAPRFGSVLCIKNHYPRSREHFLIPSAHRQTHLFGGLGLRSSREPDFRVPCSICQHAVGRVDISSNFGITMMRTGLPESVAQ